MFPRVTHPSATPPCEGVRLACVKPAASVRSEPGSNSQVVVLKISNPTKSQFIRPNLLGQHLDESQNTSVTPDRSEDTMNFGNVTVGEVLLPMPEACSVRLSANRKDPAVHVSLSSDSIVKQRGKPKLTQNVQPSASTPDQGDDNTPGKPCRAIHHQTEARKRRNPQATHQQRRRRWTPYKPPLRGRQRQINGFTKRVPLPLEAVPDASRRHDATRQLSLLDLACPRHLRRERERIAHVGPR